MRVYCTFLTNFWVRAHKETKDPSKPNPKNLLMPCHCHSIFIHFQVIPSHAIGIYTPLSNLSMPCHFHALPIHAMPCHFHAFPYHRISMPMLCLVNTCHSIAMSFPCLAKPCHDIALSCSFPCLVM
jgi:hypothetical protein